jgi:uncharacterized membrane protein YtjA (UPF0391 family)
MGPRQASCAANLAAGTWRGKAQMTSAPGNPCHSERLSRRLQSLEMRTMTILKWALIFLVVSIVAGLLGFTGVSVVSADIARVLFYVFLVIFLVLLILGLTIFRA